MKPTVLILLINPKKKPRPRAGAVSLVEAAGFHPSQAIACCRVPASLSACHAPSGCHETHGSHPAYKPKEKTPAKGRGCFFGRGSRIPPFASYRLLSGTGIAKRMGGNDSMRQAAAMKPTVLILLINPKKKPRPRAGAVSLVEAAGFEPVAFASRTQHSTKLSYASL
jgi:hypothetical protein